MSLMCSLPVVIVLVIDTSDSRMYMSLLHFLRMFYTTRHRPHSVASVLDILGDHLSKVPAQTKSLIPLLKCTKALFRLPREYWDMSSSRQNVQSVYACIQGLAQRVEDALVVCTEVCSQAVLSIGSSTVCGDVDCLHNGCPMPPNRRDSANQYPTTDPTN